MRTLSTLRNYLLTGLLTLSALVTQQQAQAQCSAAAGPTYTNFCSNQYFTAISASGPGVTSSISVTGGSCASGTTSGAGYTYFNNFTTMGVSVPPGGYVSLSLTRGVSTIGAYVTTYVDWNNNNVYESGELAGTRSFWTSGTSIMTYPFFIPHAGVVAGSNLHMRVMLSQDSTGAPCTADWGQTYDFNLYVNNCTTPTVDVTPRNITICANSTGVSLTATGAGTGGSYYWSPSTALSSTTGPNVIATPATTTQYIVRGFNSAGCPDSAMATINVNPLPRSINGPTSVCAGSTITLTDSTSGGTWTSSNTAVATINSTSGLLYGVSAGTVNITYTLSTGCRVVRATTVTAITVPAVNFTVVPGLPVCEGTRVTLNAAWTGGGSSPIFQWVINGVLIDTGRVYSYVPIDRDVVTLRMISNAVCATPALVSSTTTMSVNPTLTPHVHLSSSEGDTSCAGLPAIFTANTINGGTSPAYRWWRNGAFIGATTSSFTYAPTDGDIIMVELTSNALCRSRSIDTAYFIAHVEAFQTPTLSITSSPFDTVCQGDRVYYTAVSTYGGSAPEYWWTVNGITRGFGTTYNYVPTSGDVLKCYMASNYHCRNIDTPIATRNATVIPVITPVVSIRITPGSIVAPGANANFTATVTNGSTALSYQWYINGYPVVGAIMNYYISNRLNNNDSVMCQVTDRGRCKNFIVYGYAKINIGYNISVNDITDADTYFELYPNPTTGLFTLSMEAQKTEQYTIDILDITGKVVKSQNWAVTTGSNVQSMDATSLPKGIYLTKISAANGFSKTVKLVKE